MTGRTNWRGHRNCFVKGRHMSIEDLKDAVEAGKIRNDYVFKNIPKYPQPEFCVSLLKHDTDQEGLHGIKKSCGFKGREQYIYKDSHSSTSLLWWSLVVSPEDIKPAEQRYLEKTFPERTAEQAEMQKSFLKEFATSPAFDETSRHGPYRFTFPVEELLEAYREQFCFGVEPMMRVFETTLYKQAVIYVVLIHRPQDQERFSQYPLLTDDPGAICTFKDGHFVWRSQAMCETHRYEMGHTPDNQIEMVKMTSHEFYVWDNVSVAFHLESTEVLAFDDKQLGGKVTRCDMGFPPINNFDDPRAAESLISKLWPTTSD